MDSELALIEKVVARIHKKLIKFQKVDKRWTKSLRGACITASFLLHKALEKKGIRSVMVHSSHRSNKFGNHVWLETELYIVDITYSQFETEESIIILNKKAQNTRKYYKNFRNIIPMHSVDLFKWPASQDPIKCVERMKKAKI